MIDRKNNTIKKLITDFLEYLEVTKGLSKATLVSYRFFLNRLNEFAFSQKITKADGISLELVNKYRLALNRYAPSPGERLKKNTQNYHLIALRSFLKFLVKNDIKTLEPEKIELAKQQERQIDFIEGDDLEKLLLSPLKTSDSAILKMRDKAIIELFYSTGLRVSELAKLKIENINLKKDEFTIRGKGKKLRLVFLSDDARHWLKEYLHLREDNNPFLFIRLDKNKNDNSYEGGLTTRSIERLIEKYTRLAGITKTVTPHTIRHSYATDLLINGADIRSVQALLGHANITTTQIYTHVTDQHLKDVHKAFHHRRKKII
ncbi:MAG: tyrosine-type recombinase/integrase [Candidatus Falkowbacteria bacterium]|nr:tyrosine-type recombinase/integrase [Candidatus Falkowbacteria bacterium]